MSDPTKNDAENIQEQYHPDQLLSVICEVAEELHPGILKSLQPSLDSELDKELGFDSLGRMELLARVEKQFHINIQDELFIKADTGQDLLKAIQQGQPTDSPSEDTPFTARKSTYSHATPDKAETLIEVLNWQVETQGDECHIYLYEDSATPEPITYRELANGAQRIAAGLQAHDLKPGGTVAIMLPTGRDYFFSFLGILLAGGIPVPIYPPARLSQIEDHLRRHAKILSNAGTEIMITFDLAQKVGLLLKSQVPEIREVVNAETLLEYHPEFVRQRTQTDDIAFLQYTSGSTGNPKGVQLSHENLLANIRAMGRAVKVDAEDVFVSWLPLYHDMGLIGAWLGSLYFGFPLVLMSPLAFLAHPARWLWAIHNHKGTLSAAPNFAYELCLHRIPKEELDGLDLSSWRLAFNGAEPVSPHTVQRFSEHFSQYGLRPEAMSPVYGLAESSVGLIFPPVGRVAPIDRVNRSTLAKGRAEPAKPNDPHALEFVACGHALQGHEVRIVDSTSTELPDRHQGRLQFRGPSSTRGYFRNPEASASLFDGEWLDSGDLAYQADGDIYLTSRIKDMIIHAGRNIYPHELEEAVGEIDGIRKGCVAVFGSLNPKTQTERLIILAETRITDEPQRQDLQQKITAMAAELLGTPQDELILAPPHTVLKTSSGKIRRSACKALYEEDRLGEGQRAVWWQITRLAVASVIPQLHRLANQWKRYAYAAYSWIIFFILAIPTWTAVVLIPSQSACWKICRFSARLLFGLMGIKHRLHGVENIPTDSTYLIVANHSSYLDGAILTAALPIEPRFVAKAELTKQFFSRRFLQQIGTHFVERFDTGKSLEDSRQLSAGNDHQRPLLIFPEGTFTRQPGLLPFRMGAFTIAAEAEIPILPITINGTREILKGDSPMIQRNAISITISPAIEPAGEGWSAAITLKDKVRSELLKHLAEPDLS